MNLRYQSIKYVEVLRKERRASLSNFKFITSVNFELFQFYNIEH